MWVIGNELVIGRDDGGILPVGGSPVDLLFGTVWKGPCILWALQLMVDPHLSGRFLVVRGMCCREDNGCGVINDRSVCRNNTVVDRTSALFQHIMRV